MNQYNKYFVLFIDYFVFNYFYVLPRDLHNLLNSYKIIT